VVRAFAVLRRLDCVPEPTKKMANQKGFLLSVVAG
jgi:hypothetical protein